MTMNASLAIAVASVAGAILFFWAGYLLRILRSKEPVVIRAAEPPRAEDPKVAELETQVQSLRERASEVERLRAELQSRTAELERLGRRARELEAAARAQGSDKADRDARELRDATARVRALEADLDVARKKAADAARADDEIRRLHQRVKELSAETVSREEFSKVSTDHKDARVKVQMLEQKNQALDRYADENALLREQVKDRAALITEVTAARERIRRLESAAFAAGLKVDDAAPVVAPVSRRGEDSVFVGTTMDELLGKVTAAGKIRAIVVADEQGLLLSSSGDDRHQEPLGVVTSVIAGLGSRAREILPVGPLRTMGIVDQEGATISCRFFTVGTNRLALTAISVAGHNPAYDLERSLPGLKRIMERSTPA